MCAHVKESRAGHTRQGWSQKEVCSAATHAIGTLCCVLASATARAVVSLKAYYNRRPALAAAGEEAVGAVQLPTMIHKLIKLWNAG